MAGEESQEKTEDATDRRREQAREKGQVTRSKELNSTILLLGGVLTMYSLSSHIGTNLYEVFHNSFSFSRNYAFDVQLLLQRLGEIAAKAITTMTPLLGILLFVAILTPHLVGGLNFSTESLVPKLDRLDPIAGIKKMFSWKSLVELVKAILKFALVVGFFFTIVKAKFAEVMELDKLSIFVAISAVIEILLYTAFILSMALIVITIIDVPFQIWDHNRQLRMTKQELKDEMKDTEGKPEVRQKFKEKQREMRKRRMMSQVPKADVVITNPTHFAVAIKYDDSTMTAPVVLAKGLDLIAEMIKKVAKAHKIPFVSAPPLARALYYNVELEEEIPAGLYVAVAKVLAYIYELNRYKEGQGDMPTLSDDLSIAEEFRT